MRSYLVLALLMSFAFYGCGQKKSSSTSTIRMEQGEALSTYTQSLSLDSKTPEGVGTLLALQDGPYSQKNIGLCTWFLVDQNRAMTNSHCIPEALKKNLKLKCGDYLQGAFKTTEGISKVTCKKVIYSSNIARSSVLTNDYALIELTKNIPNARPFRLDRKGVTENDKIKVLTMNHYPSSSGIYSEFKEHHCLLKSSDILGRIESPGSSPLAGFKEEGTNDLCKAIEGNSGSPVVDGSGKLVAILHGAIKPGADLSMAGNVSSSDFTGNVAILTNLRCLKLNEATFDTDYPESCSDELKVGQPDRDKIKNEIEVKFTKLLNEAIAKQPSYLEYGINTKKETTGSLISFDPSCIKSLKEWKSTDINNIQTGRLFYEEEKYKGGPRKLSYDLYDEVRLLRNLKVDVSLKDDLITTITVKELQDLEKKKIVNSFVGKNTTFSKLPLCQVKEKVVN